MDQNSKDKTLENIAGADNIFIAVANSLGFEGLASALALYLSLVKLGKSAFIVAPNPSVDDARRLYAVDKIGNLELSAQTPVVIIKNAIENVDKVTHFLEGENLKLIINPLPGAPKIERSQITIEYESSPIGLVFALGFDNLESLRSEITHEQQIDPDTLIININSQRLNSINPQLARNQSGIGEITAKLFQDLALPIDEDIAYNLYVAMADGTNNFSPSQISEKSFEIAAWLIKFGAGRASLAQMPQAQTADKKVAFQPFPSETLPQPDFDQIIEPEQPEMENLATQPEISKASEWLKPPKIYKGSKSFDSKN